MRDKNNNPIYIDDNGTERLIQIVGISDNFGNGLKVNGRQAGTLFGDDIRTTRRVPISSGMWAHGLPLYGMNYSIVSSGRMYVEPDVNNAAYFDGTATIESGTSADGKIFIISKTLNRYQPGQLSYFEFTEGLKGINSTNGDFLLLFGAMRRGAAAHGLSDQIKEGVCIGFKKDGGELIHILRIYKNYEYTDDILDYNISDFEGLAIRRLEIGYLGIHPVLLYKVDPITLKENLIHKKVFESYYTSLSNPNLSLGVYIENKGNTTNLQIGNGSFQFGNYAERISSDPSGRFITDSYSIASIAVGTRVFFAAYTLPEILSMPKEINLAGLVNGNFYNSISNKLIDIEIFGASNKIFTIDIYLVPKADVVATFTYLEANINALQRAVGVAITSVNFTNAQLIGTLKVASTQIRAFKDFSSYDRLLDKDLVAVFTITNAQTVTDLDLIVNSIDLF